MRTHQYYNFDGFPAMLKGATKAAIGGKEWSRLSDLPPCVAVDTSGFLATVTISIQV